MSDSNVVVITGGGRGIGAGIARLLLAEGKRVVIAEIDTSTKVDFKENSSRLLFIKTDIKKESSVKKMIQKTLNHFGKMDSLINNAGILPRNTIPIEKFSLKLWDEYIQTNLRGAFLCAKHSIPHLKKQKGTIVNIASTRALQSEPHDAPYAASKGGLIALTHALAITLGPHIRANCISPGWIETEKEKLKKRDHLQHPVGRGGKPEDIAYMVSFLISEKSGFITGQNFIVDGGMTVKMNYI